jgi:hypothetical protein
MKIGRELALWIVVAAGSLIVAACSSPSAIASPSGVSATPGVSPTEPRGTTNQTVEPGLEVAAVSVSNPGAEAADVFSKCHIGDTDMILFKRVTGMGRLPAASDLPHFVPLTGREPQLKETGPVWVVTVHADIPQPGSSEVWTDPTCVVTDREFGWFATGPITDTATGKVTQPEQPAQLPDRVLPTLAP